MQRLTVGKLAGCLVLAAAVSGCSHAVSSAAIRDAQLAVRVKTALVNDPDLGIHPLEVRVIGGVVRLSGHVATEAQIAHAVSLIRSVSGVTDVIAELGVSPVAAPAPPVERQSLIDEEDFEPGARELLAVGVSVGRSEPSVDVLDNHFKLGAFVRFGNGRGLGPAIGFGWYRADWHSETPGAPTIGTVHVRPVIGGLAYSFRGDRTSLSLSLLGGMAFNSVSLPSAVTLQEIPLSIDNSLAVRSGASFWFDVNRRFAVTVGASYLATRPQVQVLADGQIRTQSLRADTVLISTGLAYKVF